MWMYWKKNAEERPWLITGIFFIGIFLPRFIIEYVKNVQVVSEYEMIAKYGINIGQALSIPFVLLGIGLVIWYDPSPPALEISQQIRRRNADQTLFQKELTDTPDTSGYESANLECFE